MVRITKVPMGQTNRKENWTKKNSLRQENENKSQFMHYFNDCLCGTELFVYMYIFFVHFFSSNTSISNLNLFLKKNVHKENNCLFFIRVIRYWLQTHTIRSLTLKHTLFWCGNAKFVLSFSSWSQWHHPKEHRLPTSWEYTQCKHIYTYTHYTYYSYRVWKLER